MFVRRVEDYIDRHELLSRGERVLVGVSGGVDSVVLLHVLGALGFEREVAHVNFGLRGADSDRDEVFVRQLCQEQGVPVHVDTPSTERYAEDHTLSIQTAARELRYAFFERIARGGEFRRLALGHHVEDQAETVLLHLLRGTGPEGLAGMDVMRRLSPDSATQVIRPLLDMHRAEIEAFSREKGIVWRTDDTNRDGKYRRGILRADVLPLLEQGWGPGVVRNIARSAEHMRGYLQDTFLPALSDAFARTAQSRTLDGATLAELTIVWRHRLILEALRRWLPGVEGTSAIVGEIAALLQAQVGRRMVFRHGTVWRTRNGLLFEPPGGRAQQVPDPMPVHAGTPVALHGGSLRVDILDTQPERLDMGAPQTVFADASRLRFPLQVRRWRHGDCFQPLGMAGKKKVSDFLSDVHVRPDRRENTWLLLSGDEVVWVVGRRLAEPYRITPRTTSFARLAYSRTDGS